MCSQTIRPSWARPSGRSARWPWSSKRAPSFALADGVHDQDDEPELGEAGAERLDEHLALAVTHPVADRVHDGGQRTRVSRRRVHQCRHQEPGSRLEDQPLDGVRPAIGDADGSGLERAPRRQRDQTQRPSQAPARRALERRPAGGLQVVERGPAKLVDLALDEVEQR